MSGSSTVLFLCSGNYYRSRFAEHLFNHLAAEAALAWRAESRGLRLNAGNIGPISEYAVSGLQQLGVPLEAEHRLPLQVVEADLHRCRHIVAVKQAEHRPLVESLFPAWLQRIEFWHIHDVDFAQPSEALPQLKQQVEALFRRMKDEG